MTLQEFISQWHNESPVMEVRTSGSTGIPKLIYIEKERMRASARMTCDFLGLHPGDSALLCMSLDYIAGKMMVVRSLERDLPLDIVEPTGHPLADINRSYDFSAMVPLQVWNSLQVDEERKKLESIRHLIIGGGAIDHDMEQELRKMKNNIWSSYGMTETLSHIALRNIHEDWYTPLPGVSLSQDEEGCLIIDAPALCATTLHTHDIVRMHPDGCRFQIIGRSDNVICSGGVKIQIEEVEACLRPVFGDTIQVTSAPHPKFGEVVVYLTTQSIDEHLLRLCLPNPYWYPKKIIQVEEVPKTPTGKPDRAEAKKKYSPSH